METNHDVFISHSSTDSKLAYAICHYLEERGIRCWIAPRDVQGGMEYAESIINGIRSCKVMVVVFSENANNSLFVKNEVERAFNYKSIIIPLKVEDIIPSATLELFLSSVHWLDAVNGNAEDYFDLLYQNCGRSLGIDLKKLDPTNEIKPSTNHKITSEQKNVVQTTSLKDEKRVEPNSNVTPILNLNIFKNKVLIGSIIVLLLSLIIIPNINWDGVFRNNEKIEDPKTGWTIEDKNVFCDEIKEISPTIICDCALEKIMPLFPNYSTLNLNSMTDTTEFAKIAKILSECGLSTNNLEATGSAADTTIAIEY